MTSLETADKQQATLSKTNTLDTKKPLGEKSQKVVSNEKQTQIMNENSQDFSEQHYYSIVEETLGRDIPHGKCQRSGFSSHR